MTTWREIVDNLPDMIRTDVEHGNLDLSDRDSWDDYAHEWADGSGHVIYTHRAVELWASEPDVYQWEDQVTDLCSPDDSIGQRISVCVYLALRHAIMSAIEEIASEDEEVTA